jgi:MFS family permease
MKKSRNSMGSIWSNLFIPQDEPCFEIILIQLHGYAPMKLTKTAILSISTLNIVMNAAIVPLLSHVSSAFPNASPTLIKMSLSLPALIGIFSSLLTGLLARTINKKTLLAAGLLIYSIGGLGAGFAASIQGFLSFRALLGFGAGICMPLSTAFVVDFYEGEERARTIGYANSAANLAAIFLPLLAARLALVNWRYAFFVYAIGLAILVLTSLVIPKRAFPINAKAQVRLNLAAFSPVIGIVGLNFAVILFFYTLPSNLSMHIQTEGIGSPSSAALAVAISTLSTTLVSLKFASLLKLLKKWILPLGLGLLAFGFYAITALGGFFPVVLGQILIGASFGMLFSYFPYRVAQLSPPDLTTGSLSLLSGASNLGMFLSPIFFLGASSLLNFDTIKAEFTLAAILFAIFTLLSSFRLFNKQERGGE